MSGTTFYSIIIILLIAVLTFGARFFPFLVFGRGKEISPMVKYLGEVLPPAVMVLLIIYTVRNMKILGFPYGIPELGAILLTFLAYKITKNNLVAILVGTAAFMIAIRMLL